MLSIDEPEGNAREGSLCSVLGEPIHRDWRNHSIEMLVILNEPVVDAGGSYRKPGKDDDDEAYMTPATSAGGLDVFSCFLRNAIHNHQIDPLEINAVADHIGRDNRVKKGCILPGWRAFYAMNQLRYFGTGRPT